MQGGPRASQLSLVLSEKVGVAGGLLRHIVQADGGRAVVAAAAASMLRANTLNDLCKYEHGTEKDADEDPGARSDAAPKCMGSGTARHEQQSGRPCEDGVGGAVHAETVQENLVADGTVKLLTVLDSTLSSKRAMGTETTKDGVGGGKDVNADIKQVDDEDREVVS